MALLQAQNIEKNYAGHQALTNVTISVEEKSVFGLLGPNGAGKTTLIRIINQITAPDQGHILFEGRPLRESDVERIGYLPEERGLYKKMKVGEQAIYLAQLKGLSRHDALIKLRYWFQKFEIEPWWNKKVMELSKGMQQKIQFICTVLHEPRLLIFDEPFSGFDPINANMIKDEMLDLKAQGSTIIFSTHNMASVEELCDHIALINNSEKILDGKVNEIRNRYKTNNFEVNYKGSFESIGNNLPGEISIIEHQETDSINTLKLHFESEESGNSILKALLPHAEIRSFREIIPSMNEVFIRVVEESNKQ